MGLLRANHGFTGHIQSLFLFGILSAVSYTKRVMLNSTTTNDQVTLLGQSASRYVERAELPVVVLTTVIVLVYLISFWLPVSYLGVVTPLILLIQVIVSAGVGYLTGVRGGASWLQTALVGVLVAGWGGVVSAILALFRFNYYWLIPNIITEPVWSGILGAIISALTVGFFNLPGIAQRYSAKLWNTKL